MQITGVLLAFFLVFGYLFAATWPGRRWVMKKLRIEEIFTSYEVFYVTHAIMGVALIVLLVIHPLPGKPSTATYQKGTTWIYMLPGTAVCLVERFARSLK